MKLSTAHVLYKILMLTALLSGLAVPVLGYSPLATGLLILCIVSFACGFFVLTRRHRCPHCGEVVSPRGKLPKDCPECGEELQPGKKN